MLNRIRNSIRNSINQIGGYSRSIKLFLTIPILFGMYYAIRGLFFNFYILAMGMDRGFIQAKYGFSPIFITTGILYAVSTVMIWTFFKNVPEPLITETATA